MMIGWRDRLSTASPPPWTRVPVCPERGQSLPQGRCDATAWRVRSWRRTVGHSLSVVAACVGHPRTGFSGSVTALGGVIQRGMSVGAAGPCGMLAARAW